MSRERREMIIAERLNEAPPWEYRVSLQVVITTTDNTSGKVLEMRSTTSLLHERVQAPQLQEMITFHLEDRWRGVFNPEKGVIEQQQQGSAPIVEWRDKVGL